MADVEQVTERLRIGGTTELKCQVCGKVWTWEITNPFLPTTCMEPGCLHTALGNSGLLFRRKSGPAQEDANRILCRQLGIEAEYHNASLNDFDRELRPMFTAGDSYLIKGKNGRGKTHFACAMLRHLVAQGQGGLFITANVYLKRVRSSYHKSARESEMDILREMVEPEVLVLDDLGAEKQGDFGLGEILTLLSERSVRHKTNIVTTNLTLTEIHKAEPRLASRLAAYTDIELTGEDRRVKP